MFYRLLYFFGFIPKPIQVLCLIVCFITSIYYFYRKHNISKDVYLPAILLSISHLCERLIRWIGNGNQPEINFWISVLIVLTLLYAVNKLLSASLMFLVALALTLIACISSNVLALGLFIPIAQILLIIAFIKAIIHKNQFELIAYIILFGLSILKPSIGWTIELAFISLMIFFIYGILALSTSKKVVYGIIAILLCITFNCWIAIEFILIIEMIAQSIKAKAPLNLIMMLAVNFFIFWLLAVLFSNNLLTIVLIIILIILIKALIGV